jgi:hypothetical protein
LQQRLLPPLLFSLLLEPPLPLRPQTIVVTRLFESTS